MDEEKIIELCRAFALGVSIDTISDFSEKSKDELYQFVEDHKEQIAEIQTYIKNKE